MERVMCLTTFWFNGRRMVWLVALCHCVVSFQGKGWLDFDSGMRDVISPTISKYVVDVHYQRKIFKELMGTSLTLTCKTTYAYKLCLHVEVGWHQNQRVGLTDPSRYLTTVNETILEDNRLRQVTTTILSLISEDNGEFQCRAECENGEQARGHYVEVIVKDQSE